MKDWAEGPAARFALDGCEIDELALRRLVEFGAGHPRATMLIAQKTHMTSVLLETRTIDLAAVEQGYRTALEGERVNHEQSLERLRGVHRYALEVARSIARGEPPTATCPATRRDARSKSCGGSGSPAARAGAIGGSPIPCSLATSPSSTRCSELTIRSGADVDADQNRQLRLGISLVHLDLGVVQLGIEVARLRIRVSPGIPGHLIRGFHARGRPRRGSLVFGVHDSVH